MVICYCQLIISSTNGSVTDMCDVTVIDVNNEEFMDMYLSSEASTVYEYAQKTRCLPMCDVVVFEKGSRGILRVYSHGDVANQETDEYARITSRLLDIVKNELRKNRSGQS